MIPFEQRVSVFQRLLELDKQQESSDITHGGRGHDQGWRGGLRVEIRRDHVVEDSFLSLAQVEAWKLKRRIQVEFISEQGSQCSFRVVASKSFVVFPFLWSNAWTSYLSSELIVSH